MVDHHAFLILPLTVAHSMLFPLVGAGIMIRYEKAQEVVLLGPLPKKKDFSALPHASLLP